MQMASSSAPRPTTARFLSKAESAPGLMKTPNFPSTTTLDSGSGTSSTVSTLVAPPRGSYPGLLPTWEAEQAIREFIDRHWSHRADYIKVDCRLTLPELRALGRLSREEGSLACRRLIRVPAIHEEVALSLWEHLAEEEEKEAEEEEEAGDAAPTAVVTVPSFSQMPLVDPSAAGDARVVPANNSSCEAAEPRTRRRRPRQRRLPLPLRLPLRLKSLVTSLLFPETRAPPPPKPHTTPALNRTAAGNPHSCPFCSGDCATSLSAAARQQQQQQQAHKPALWRRENASASPPPCPPPCPPPSPRLSGDTLTASRTGESAGRAEASASEKGDARSKPRPAGPVFHQPAPGLMSLWKGQQPVGRERRRRASG
ncbi:uncharacterized protein P884DRAFT_203633 [Thermothelomyces heterothallicus CBS 202.75]|uniref:uncharacterized protein n=1 Tax=Thermothelomyces heterothallicus CBS 202.75 TaxID=1149848 RepID=UPI003742ED39